MLEQYKVIWHPQILYKNSTCEISNIYFTYISDSLKAPYDLTVLLNGNIAVTDYEDEAVKIFSHTGKHTYINNNTELSLC